MGTGGNGDSTLGNPMGIGMSQKFGNWMVGNWNRIDGNVREWECWKPFPHTSTFALIVFAAKILLKISCDKTTKVAAFLLQFTDYRFLQTFKLS